jgi:bifunctional DNA-binding transcriptional regulator/antitoxin component of YhaV-PrlF toxin-antitoxin module
MYTKIIQKATSSGQITLPSAWRQRFSTNNYLIEAGDSFLKVTPFDRDNIANRKIVFDNGETDERRNKISKDELTASLPPTRDKQKVMLEFRKAGKYSEQFLKSLEKGLSRSSHFNV